MAGAILYIDTCTWTIIAHHSRTEKPFSFVARHHQNTMPTHSFIDFSITCVPYISTVVVNNFSMWPWRALEIEPRRRARLAFCAAALCGHICLIAQVPLVCTTAACTASIACTAHVFFFYCQREFRSTGDGSSAPIEFCAPCSTFYLPIFPTRRAQNHRPNCPARIGTFALPTASCPTSAVDCPLFPVRCPSPVSRRPSHAARRSPLTAAGLCLWPRRLRRTSCTARRFRRERSLAECRAHAARQTPAQSPARPHLAQNARSPTKRKLRRSRSIFGQRARHGNRDVQASKKPVLRSHGDPPCAWWGKRSSVDGKPDRPDLSVPCSFVELSRSASRHSCGSSTFTRFHLVLFPFSLPFIAPPLAPRNFHPLSEKPFAKLYAAALSWTCGAGRVVVTALALTRESASRACNATHLGTARPSTVSPARAVTRRRHTRQLHHLRRRWAYTRAQKEKDAC